LRVEFPTMIKNKILNFINSDKDTPLLAGLICGLYPLLYFYSNYFFSKNSLEQFATFFLLFVGVSVFVFSISYFIFNRFPALKKYKKHLLFVLIIIVVATFLSQIIYFKLMKKALVLIYILAFLLSLKFYKSYKKLLVLVVLMCIFPFCKIVISLYDSFKPLDWQEQPDAIENVELTKTPNIYLIQPDGYVSKEVLSQAPYNSESEIYNWLETEGFKVYPDFRSNYPATLTSNASMFSMKHHYFGEYIFPSLEMLNARDVISGENPVISILDKNDYSTFLVVENEYFQHNNSDQKYDYRNISLKEIPLFSHGGNVEKDVLVDLKEMMKIDASNPKFFFVEKLMPHHVILYDDITDVEIEREWYLSRIKEANLWLKKTINHIAIQDPDAIVIVIADHGGMLGLDNFTEKYNSIQNMNSIFSSLLAIKWNGNLVGDEDAKLKSNVNLFRVLFSVLSEDKTYLNNLEEDESYYLDNKNGIFRKPQQAIQSNGDYNLKKGAN